MGETLKQNSSIIRFLLILYTVLISEVSSTALLPTEVGYAGNVRRNHDVRMAPERVIWRQRLGLKNVQAGTRQMPGIQSRQKVLLDQVRAPGDVDKVGSGRQFPE